MNVLKQRWIISIITAAAFSVIFGGCATQADLLLP